MRSRLSILLLVATLLCNCATKTRELVASRPDRWDAELLTSVGLNQRIVLQIHDYGRGFTELVVRQGERDKPLRSYETLCVSKISDNDLSFLYDAVVQTLRDFQFGSDVLPFNLDGGYAQVELRIGARSMSAGFSSFKDIAELPSSVQKIMKFADRTLSKQTTPKPNDA